MPRAHLVDRAQVERHVTLPGRHARLEEPVERRSHAEGVAPGHAEVVEVVDGEPGVHEEEVFGGRDGQPAPALAQQPGYQLALLDVEAREVARDDRGAGEVGVAFLKLLLLRELLDSVGQGTRFPVPVV
jgi:hypothetical protein